MSAAVFSVESFPRCFETRDIGIAVAPLTLCQTWTKSNKQIEREGEMRILKRCQGKKKQKNWVSFYLHVLGGKAMSEVLRHT
jgi:hypothetical protein